MDIFNAAIDLVQTIRFQMGGSGACAERYKVFSSAHALLHEITALDISGRQTPRGKEGCA
jgi:hypothetical protein